MEPIITLQNVRKQYGQKEVLHGINLDILPGQVIGYIGPNGAGKSTTVRILAGLDEQFTGEVRIKGLDVRKDNIAVKRIIGYIPEQTELYDVLTPMEFLLTLGRLHDMPDEEITQRATRMLTQFGLAEHLHNRMDTFSKGMRQKVLLVSGLLHNPEIIFMDEPLSGLDANAVIVVKEIIARLATQGKTIFYCSHNMDTVERISDRIILIADGRIAADGPIEQLRATEGDTLENIFSKITGQNNFDQVAGAFLDSLNKPQD